MPRSRTLARTSLLTALPLLLLLGLAAVLPGRASAADAAATVLALSAPVTVRSGGQLVLRTELRSGSASVGDAEILLEVGVADAWTPVGTVRTDGTGTASLSLPAPADSSTYRASFAGSPAHGPSRSDPVTVVVGPVASKLTLTGPAALVDERSARLRITWRGADGLPVAGEARLWFHGRNQKWRPGPVLRTDAAGRAEQVVRPRNDIWYQVRGAAGTGWKPGSSASKYLNNKPPGVPVILPAKAPRPRALPAQRRAIGTGAAVTVTKIPDAVWKRMAGRSWRQGCLARSDLRYLQVNYWGFDGYRHRGELVVRANVAAKFSRVLKGLYAARLPIRSMYLPDRFGFSRRSGGADDYASMRADNTSAFNCRWVSGNPGVRSPHSSGRSIDLNPFENPFHSRVGWLPNGWWVKHSHPRYAWRSSKHQVVRILRAAGFRWTYGHGDTQHFDA